MASQNAVGGGSASRTQTVAPNTPNNTIDYSRSNVRGSGFSQNRTSSTRTSQKRRSGR